MNRNRQKYDRIIRETIYSLYVIAKSLKNWCLFY